MPAVQKPFGRWASPLTAASLAENTITFAEVLVDSADGRAYHVEARPAEQGRNVLVDSSTGHVITPEDQNTRTVVHEYGGGAAAVHRGRAVISDVKSSLAYELKRQGDSWSGARRIVPDNNALRYADFAPHPTDDDLTLAICEDHTVDQPAQVVNSVVLIRSAAQSIETIASGADFYAAPRWNADGSHLCWIEWRHPYMCWECSEVYVTSIDGGGKVGKAEKVAGSTDGSESISQCRWALDGKTLLFLSDVSGYYNLRAWTTTEPKVKTLLPTSAKTDLGSPDWQLNQSTFQPLTEDLVLVRTKPSELSLFSLSSGSMRPLDASSDNLYSQLRVIHKNKAICQLSSLTSPARLVTFDPSAETLDFETIKRTTDTQSDDGYVSKPREIIFEAGPDPGMSSKVEAYAWYYEPKNKDFEGVEGSKPPLIIKCHGGPTSASSPALDLSTQFWTSRGFAVADVNYGGSTGKGKVYRDRLRGQWGVVDVEDCAACVSHLVKTGQVDEKRVVVTGRSSGGFTVLASLVKHSDVYAAGASTCGIASLTALAEHTHKFESQYLFNLLGGTPSQISEVYADRAPLTHADRIRSALIVLQGSDDPIVPVAQAESIVAALRQRNIRCEYELFEGEGHSFRRAESVIRAAEHTIAFFLDVLDIKDA